MKALVSKTVRKVIALLLILLVSGTGNVFADVMYYVHTDHLGTPAVITDSTQKKVWQGNKQPFGKTEVSVNLIEFNARFPGQYYDAESGLHYNYFRDYDPATGRYVQSDPIGLLGGLNSYSYSTDNPVNYIDKYGLAASTSCDQGAEIVPLDCAPGMPRMILGGPGGGGGVGGVGPVDWGNEGGDIVKPPTLPGPAGKLMCPPLLKGRGRVAGPVFDKATGHEVGRFVVDSKGNAMIEPIGGRTVPAGKGGVDTHTLYPNGSNYHRLNPQGHSNNSTPHGHGHLLGTGAGIKGQGASTDSHGNVVPRNSSDAHWPIF